MICTDEVSYVTKYGGVVAAVLKEERQSIILERLEKDRQVRVAGLSDALGVSKVTIRRDLREMDEQGKLRRAHGGAVVAEPAPPEPPVVQRLARVKHCKECIGREAAALVADGESVFIGSGSTTACVARNLTGRRNLTVVTNALSVGTELAGAVGVTVVVTGGMMRHSELSLVGHIAEQSLREVRVDKVIMGMQAISLEAGMTNDYLPEVMTDRTILEMAPDLIVVADHTKFGKVASAFIAPTDRITTLITDSEASAEFVSALEQMGVRVIVAAEEGERD
jgi:DeoR/GlpR family transcriptional regulator of sugar metabolism